MKKITDNYEEKKLGKEGIKFYNKYGIVFGAFLGGPLATVYLIYKNYINFGKKEYAKRTITIGAIGVILICLIMYSLPDSFSKASYLIPLIISYLCFNKLQGKEIENILKKGGKLYSFWNVLGIGILFLSISLIILLILGSIVGNF